MAQAQCRIIDHEGREYAVCEAAAGSDLRLFLNDFDGFLLGAFARVQAHLSAGGEDLVFAMNAGMYHPTWRPVGLYIEAGVQETPLITRAGPGNFGMLPNGVFCIGEAAFAVIETRSFAETPPKCRFATQSGPMLAIDGALYPRFRADGTSRFIRNGVGVTQDGRAVFVISEQPVTFHKFARLFRDVLTTPQALYLDGSISQLYAPDLNRADLGLPMGPIVGLVAPKN
ncbi:phosphodiester glycosidase family protein [Halovulum sp. GXIMD14793]